MPQLGHSDMPATKPHRRTDKRLRLHDWQLFQTETLRRELIGALARLVRGHSERYEFEPAIGYARRWLSHTTFSIVLDWPSWVFLTRWYPHLILVACQIITKKDHASALTSDEKHGHP